MPTRRSCRPHRAASLFSSAGEVWAWRCAEGMRSKPFPCSRCTRPPSWSAATMVSMPSGFRAALAGLLDHCRHPSGPGGGVAEQDDRAGPAVVDGGRRRGADPVGGDGHHHQLTDPLPQAERARQVRAADRAARRVRRWASPTGRTARVEGRGRARGAHRGRRDRGRAGADGRRRGPGRGGRPERRRWPTGGTAPQAATARQPASTPATRRRPTEDAGSERCGADRPYPPSSRRAPHQLVTGSSGSASSAFSTTSAMAGWIQY